MIGDCLEKTRYMFRINCLSINLSITYPWQRNKCKFENKIDLLVSDERLGEIKKDEKFSIWAKPYFDSIQKRGKNGLEEKEVKEIGVKVRL